MDVKWKTKTKQKKNNKRSDHPEWSKKCDDDDEKKTLTFDLKTYDDYDDDGLIEKFSLSSYSLSFWFFILHSQQPQWS